MSRWSWVALGGASGTVAVLLLVLAHLQLAAAAGLLAAFALYFAVALRGAMHVTPRRAPAARPRRTRPRAGRR